MPIFAAAMQESRLGKKLAYFGQIDAAKFLCRRYTATFIDFGYCFNAGEWSFCDSPLRGVYVRNEVYKDITSWEDFTPWLERIEQLRAEQMHEVADEIPPEWYGSRDELDRLLRCLIERRSLVRDLIDSFRTSSRNPFPNWA